MVEPWLVFNRRRSRDKMPMVRLNSPDMPLIRTKKVPLGISAVTIISWPYQVSGLVS